MLFEDDAVLIDCGFTFDETKFLSQELSQLKDIVSLKPLRSDSLELHLKQVTTHIDEYKGKMIKKNHILFTEDDKHVENIFQRLLIHKQRLELFISNKNKFDLDQTTSSTTSSPVDSTSTAIVAAVPLEQEVIEKIVIQSDPIVIERCTTLESELASKDAQLVQLQAQIADLNNQHQEQATKHELELQSQQEELQQAQANKSVTTVVQTSHPEDEFLEPIDTTTSSTHDHDEDEDTKAAFEEGAVDENGNPVDAAHWNKRFKYKTARLAPEYNAFQTNYIEELLQEVERLTLENTTLSTKSSVSEADQIYYQVLSQQRQSEIEQWELYANQQDFKINQLQGEVTQLTLILLEQAQQPRTQLASTPDVADTTTDIDTLDEKEQSDTPAPAADDVTDTVLTIIPSVAVVSEKTQEEPTQETIAPAALITTDSQDTELVAEEKEVENIIEEDVLRVSTIPDNISTSTPISTPTAATSVSTNVTYVEPSSKFCWDEEEFLQDEINFRAENDTVALDQQITQLRQKLDEYDTNLINHGQEYYLPRDSRKKQRIILHLSRLSSVQSGNGVLSAPSTKAEVSIDQDDQVDEKVASPSTPAFTPAESNDEDNNLEKEKYLNTTREVVELSKEILLQAQGEAEALKTQLQSQDESLLELRSQLSTEEQERRRLVVELGDEREIKRAQKKQIAKLQGDNINLVERNATLVDKYEFCLLNHSPVHED